MRRFVVIIAGLTSLSGCGNVTTRPHVAMETGGLVPTQEDRDAGLVGIVSGFDLQRYRTIVVERFVVSDRGLNDAEDQELAAMAPGYLHEHLMRRLKEVGVFDRVVESLEAANGGGIPYLRLTGDIVQVQPGSRHLRFWIGFGAGRSKVEIHTRFVDGATNAPVLVTATRRVAAMSEALSLDYGGSGEDLVKDALRDTARDLARFLSRLSHGDAPRSD